MTSTGLLKCAVHRCVYPLLPTPKTKLVIIASGRSGSNLLVSLLNSHPEIHQYGEVIGESYVRRSDVHQVIGHVGAARYVRNTFHKRFYKKVVGIKVLYYQFQVPYGRRWDVPGVEDVLRDIRQDTQIKIIHLKRYNALKIYLSNEIARLTGEYVVRNKQGSDASVSISLGVEECRQFFEGLEETKKEFDGYFSRHPVFQTTYQELVRNREAVCRDVQDFLGVRRVSLGTNTVRQNRRSLSDRIDNYDELKAAFQRTPWADYFED